MTISLNSNNSIHLIDSKSVTWAIVQKRNDCVVDISATAKINPCETLLTGINLAIPCGAINAKDTICSAFSKLQCQITNISTSGVLSVTDDGSGVVVVNNTDPQNPIVGFGGVNTDGVTITGDGSTGSPLVAIAGSGSVTSFSSGNLSPLFTTSVANPNTTPSLSFALVSQNASLVYASPNGVAGVPSFRALNFIELGDVPNTYAGSQFDFPMVNFAETGLVFGNLIGAANNVVVEVATTGNVVLSGNQLINGVLNPATVLVWQQTVDSENGVYDTSAGAWTRMLVADTAAEYNDQVVYVIGGTLYAARYFNQIEVVVTLNTDPINYQINAIGGAGGNNWRIAGNNAPVANILGTINNRTVRLFTNNIQRGSWDTSGNLNWGSSSQFVVNASGRITKYDNAAPTDGQLLIGDTAAGYFKMASLTAGAGITITPGAGSISIAASISTIAWLLNGNTVGSIKWIGTVDNFDFPIRTNSVENARVFTGGQTGFGITASPLGKVHIRGIAAGYALYTETNAGAFQNWSIRDDGELRYNTGRGAYINGNSPSSTYFGFQTGINMSNGNTGFGCRVLGGTGAGVENVAMGGESGTSVTSGEGNVFYGYNTGNAYVTANGANRVAITTGFNNTFIGQRTGANSSSRTASIAIGCYAMTTADFQMVIGGTADAIASYRINDVYIGQGVSLEAINFGQSSINIQTTGISAGQTDISAAPSYLAWCSAIGTGTGIGGDIRFYSAPASTTGNTRNALFRQIDFRGDGKGMTLYQKATPLIPAVVVDGFTLYSNDYSGAGTASPFIICEDGTVLDLRNMAAGSVTSVSGTANRITSTGGTSPIIDISAAYVGQTSITTLGTVTTGTLGAGAIIGAVTMTLASNGTGDIYYRSSLGILTRLAVGSNGDVLTLAAGLPSWAAPTGGSQTPWTSDINADGFILNGNDGSGETLTIRSTSHATKGFTYIGASTSFAFDEVNFRLGITQAVPTAKIDITTNALGVTQLSTSGLALVNTTAAVLGAQQISPAIRWSGLGFATSGSTSQATEFQAYVLPAQGSSAPTSQWVLQSSINGAAFATIFNITNGGATTTVTLQATSNISSGNQIRANGASAVTSLTFRLQNGASNITPLIASGDWLTTAGSLGIAIDSANSLVFTHANGTRQIAGAGIAITNLDNTLGSEDSDLIFLTQAAGGAMTQKMRISNLGNIVAGAEVALATTATDGDLYVPSCAGVPTGVPSGYTGKIALRMDATNNKAYIYSGGAWVALN